MALIEGHMDGRCQPGLESCAVRIGAHLAGPPGGRVEMPHLNAVGDLRHHGRLVVAEVGRWLGDDLGGCLGAGVRHRGLIDLRRCWRRARDPLGGGRVCREL